MTAPSKELERLIFDREDKSAADGFADVVEEHIEFGGTADDYFASVLRLPSPLLELYAALIFNTTVGGDGLAFAIPRYDHHEFVAALARGLILLGEDNLLSLVERARKQLNSESSRALQSNTPNVTLDQEAPELSNSAYSSESKTLMPRIGAYLKSNRERVLAAASRLGVPTE